MASTMLTASSLRELLASGRLPAAPGSPLPVAGRGSDAGPATAPPAALEPALHVLAAPEALLRLRTVVPGEAVVATPVALRGGQAVPFVLREGGGIEVFPGSDAASLSESLAREVTYAGPLAKQQVVIWPTVLKVLMIVWGEKRDASAPVSRQEALAQLSSGGTPEEVERTIREVVRTGFAQESGNELRIAERYVPWLALAWSGHAFQIEYVPLPAGVNFEAALAADGERLVFVGPPGRRVFNDELTGQALAQATAGGKPSEDRLIRLSTPPYEALLRLVRLLLRAPA